MVNLFGWCLADRLGGEPDQPVPSPRHAGAVCGEQRDGGDPGRDGRAHLIRTATLNNRKASWQNLFGLGRKEYVRAEVIRLLHAVKLDEHYYERMPGQLSGGEKQRVGIARAFAGRPDLVLCDEPVSALDVSVQAAVLNLLLEIQREQATTMIFIAHDLSVVRFFSDYVAVMYLGQVVEIGPAEAIYLPPYHPYTESLLAAVPIPDPHVDQQHIRLEGSVPSSLHPPSGCRFHTRCPRRSLLADNGAICEHEAPPWRDADDGHRIHCHFSLDTLRSFGPVIQMSLYGG